MKRYLEKKKIKNSKKRRLLTGVLMSTVLFSESVALSGCSQYENKSESSDRYIAVICKGTQHEFWKSVEQGARDAGEEINAKITFEAPEDESMIKVQIEMVEKAIENKADAIVLAPLDTVQLNDVIEEAELEGIPVLTLDSDVESNVRVASIGTDNIIAGAIAARKAADLIGEEGEIAIISHVKGAQTALARNVGFTDEIEAINKDSMKIVDVEYSGGESKVAKQQAKELIARYPDLKCIYATNEGSAVGAAAAIKSLGLKDDIVVIGFDSSEQEIAYLEEGYIDGMMVQNPYNMGYLGVRNINKVLNGENIEELINTGATYVDRTNLKDEDTQWLLYPMGNEE